MRPNLGKGRKGGNLWLFRFLRFCAEKYRNMRENVPKSQREFARVRVGGVGGTGKMQGRPFHRLRRGPMRVCSPLSSEKVKARRELRLEAGGWRGTECNVQSARRPRQSAKPTRRAECGKRNGRRTATDVRRCRRWTQRGERRFQVPSSKFKVNGDGHPQMTQMGAEKDLGRGRQTARGRKWIY